MLFWCPLYAQIDAARQAPEYKIKAVYLYNFLLFVEWPQPDNISWKSHSPLGAIEPVDSSDKIQDTDYRSGAEKNTIVIGILGRDPFGDSFVEVEGKMIKAKKKKLIVKRFGSYKKEMNLTQCHLLFICSSENKNRENILADLGTTPVLTVSDAPGFLEAGGMINLVKVEKKIRWEINRTPAVRACLRLSSQLLRNAVRIVEIPKLAPSEKGKTFGQRQSYDNSIRPAPHAATATHNALRNQLLQEFILLGKRYSNVRSAQSYH